MLPPFPRRAAPPSPNPAVRIVITKHDHARFLGSPIDSVLGQGGLTVEVIVVEDGSKDGSRDSLALYGDALRVLFQARHGPKAAFNAAFAIATGDIILFL